MNLKSKREKKTGKTSNAVEILRRRHEKDPELQRLYEEEKLKDQIARKILELRTQMHISQTDLAGLLQIPLVAVERLENSDY